MKKIAKIIIITAICVAIAVAAFVPLRDIWYEYLLLWSIEDNPDFDADTNEQIRNLIYQFYVARYTRRDVDRSIFTEENRILEKGDGFFTYMFEHNSRIFLFSTDRHYMQGLMGLDNSQRLSLSLRFNDMPAGFWDTRLLTRGIHVFDFEKDHNGIWRISQVVGDH